MFSKAAITLSLASFAYAGGDGVVHLTNADFDKKVTDTGAFALVKFFAPWCGHCKALRPAWDKLGEKYNVGNPNIMVADVDCTVEESLCGKFSVQGYPTIKYFGADAQPEGSDYNGGRSFEDLDSFMVEKQSKMCSYSEQSKCGDKEKAYITKMDGKTVEDVEKEIARLMKLSSGSMTAEKKSWASTRKLLLQGMLDARKKDTTPTEL